MRYLTGTPRFDSRARVVAVVVSYRPDLQVLDNALTQIENQVDQIVIVDNTADDTTVAPASLAASHHARYLPQSCNLGLAAALNIGIDAARAAGATHVLLLDQDSIATSGMVNHLLTSLQAAGDCVAAAGPVYRNTHNGRRYPFWRVGFPRAHKINCNADTVVECDFLITSGSLIPIGAIDAVGLMDGGLFIDNVDLDWCFRARKTGWRLLGVGAATLDHTLGDRVVTILGTTGLGVALHGPQRQYFITRNRLLMYRRPHTPWRWIAQDIIRLPLKMVLLAMHGRPRRASLAAMFHGFIDGVRGHDGPARRLSRSTTSASV